MNRRFLPMIIAASLVMAAGTARADGYAAPQAAAAPPMLTVSSWAGAYGGINGGYAWNDNSADFLGDQDGGAGSTMVDFAFGVVSANLTQFPLGLDGNGFVGGGQLGYNWQHGKDWVAGVETDLQFADVDGDGVSTGVFPGLNVTAVAQQDLKWFGTLRGRVGFLPAEHVLLFGTAGLAYGKTDASASIATNVAAAVGGAPGNTFLLCPPILACIAGSDSKTSLGWTIGGGFEWALWDHVTFKGEYLHVDLGDQTVSLVAQSPATGNGFASASFDNTFEIIRGGVNFRF